MEKIKAQYVIQQMFPDGPHWYEGIRKRQVGEAVYAGPSWSPYWEDRKAYIDKVDALEDLDKLKAQNPNAEVVQIAKAKSEDTRRVDSDTTFYIRFKYLQAGDIFRKVHGIGPKYVVIQRTNDRIHYKYTDMEGADVEEQADLTKVPISESTLCRSDYVLWIGNAVAQVKQ